MTNWDERGIELAQLVGSWSKDPTTKVGAAILRPDRTVAAVGFNGLPRGIEDDERLSDRAWKHMAVVHAEENAIVSAQEPLHGCTLYVTPLSPCSRCAATIIQAGIRRVVYSCPVDRKDWAESGQVALDMFHEAGIEVEELILPRKR